MTSLSLGRRSIFNAVVTLNRKKAERFYKLKLEFSGSGAEALKNFKPGQFAQLDLSTAALPSQEKIPQDLSDESGRLILLRRPFSFIDVTVLKDKTTAELLYSVVGPATLRMTGLAAGDSLSVIGPLGNGFSAPQGKKTTLMVAGGMGAPPLLHLAKILSAEHPDMEAIVFAGAKTVKDLPFENRLDKISQELGYALSEFATYGFTSQVATDDGSAGHHGPVTNCLSQWMQENRPEPRNIIIYSCGPEAMLAKVAEIAGGKTIDCQVSMERRMACGFGVCQSCAVECKVAGSNETIYKLCCEDGPVFDGKEIIFAV